ncbi:hypothetical protein BDB00DRAFT_918256 [Zychaea mexicana]|uniref:uncharacterized protein n=1 Tax=Zychaea mexicana TaxID=64656 RepID=UPI0022FF3833|nr:uncharacterized protein BDB00DRAFT_918256 [Zychaea mexicana]KAI9490104.1 hypothetical protein BDB00DRAFT_918256 [Zychaea mexicana]
MSLIRSLESTLFKQHSVVLCKITLKGKVLKGGGIEERVILPGKHQHFECLPLPYVCCKDEQKYESAAMEYFSPSLLEATRQDILTSLALPDSLDAHLYMSAKNRDYHENKVSNLTARRYWINLAMTKDNAECNVVLAIASLFPALKDLG